MCTQQEQKIAFKKYQYLEILAAKQDSKEGESKREGSNIAFKSVLLKAQCFVVVVVVKCYRVIWQSLLMIRGSVTCQAGISSSVV